MARLLLHARLSLIVGVLVIAGSVAGFYLVGRLYSDTDALGLLQAMIPSIQSFCTALVTGISATVALVLTIINLSSDFSKDFKHEFYDHVRVIALAGTAALLLAGLVLLIATIPLTEVEALNAWYRTIYAVLVVLTAVTAGLFAVISINMYQSIISLVGFVSPRDKLT